MKNTLLFGFGHKARQGKDTAALYLKQKLPNTVILSWAEEIYTECTNLERKFPLIQKEFDTKEKTYYTVLANAVTGERTAISNKNDPFLHKIFTERNINIYWGMDSKDRDILQFWGTNYRRNLCNENYWINKLLPKIENLMKDNNTEYIIIPDTRFKNEVNAIRSLGGYYVKIVRVDEQGNLYLHDDKIHEHESEKDLDNYPPDATIVAHNLQTLYSKLDEFIDNFIIPAKNKNRIG